MQNFTPLTNKLAKTPLKSRIIYFFIFLVLVIILLFIYKNGNSEEILSATPKTNRIVLTEEYIDSKTVTKAIRGNVVAIKDGRIYLEWEKSRLNLKIPADVKIEHVTLPTKEKQNVVISKIITLGELKNGEPFYATVKIIEGKTLITEPKVVIGPR